MKKLIVGAFLLLSAQGIFAMPLDRSIKEIRDIISSHELKRLIPSSESILDIRRVSGGYMILTNRYQLFVEVIYGPRGAEAEREGGDATLRFNELKESKQ